MSVPYPDTQPVADLVAEVMHKALDAVDENWHLSCMDPDGDGSCSKGHRARQMLAEDVAPAVLDALAAAGLLLPEGAETRTEWGVWWYGPIGDGIRLTQDKFASRAAAGQHAPTRIGDYGITRYEIRRRIHRVFPDGSSWSGPWAPADAVRLAVGDSKPTQDHGKEN